MKHLIKISLPNDNRIRFLQHKRQLDDFGYRNDLIILQPTRTMFLTKYKNLTLKSKRELFLRIKILSDKTNIATTYTKDTSNSLKTNTNSNSFFTF